MGGGDADVRTILKARLRGIVLYEDDGENSANQWTTSLSGGAAKLISESVNRLTRIDPDRAVRQIQERIRGTLSRR